MQENDAVVYYVWGVDNVAYGPIELPALVNWVQDERVVADSWIHRQDDAEWTRARDIPELKIFFRDKGPVRPDDTTITRRLGPDVQPAKLRRIKLFAGMDDLQILSFAKYLESVTVRQFATVVSEAEEGDGMYLILEGELRTRSAKDGREVILSTMGPGEFFGEMALLDHGLRSADVVANKDSVLLKISSKAFDRIVREAPALATPFLCALNKTEVARLRQLTAKYEASLNFSRSAGAGVPQAA